MTNEATNTTTAGGSPLDGGVRPRAWLCEWPTEKGGGGFVTVDEATAQHYMRKTAGAGVTLVQLYGQEALDDLQFEADFYRRRCDALQAWQSRMRDPERTVVCDILANGFTLPPAVAGGRYGDPGPNARLSGPQRPAQEVEHGTE